MLEKQYKTFHNGSWVHLTVNGESPAHIATLWPGNLSVVGVRRGKKGNSLIQHVENQTTAPLFEKNNHFVFWFGFLNGWLNASGL